MAENAVIDITGALLVSPRLLLRPFEEKDLDDFFEYASVPNVGEWAGWPHHQNKEITQKVLDSFIRTKKTFAIVYKDNMKVIGSVGLEEYKGDLQGFPHFGKGREIGYVLSKDYWGKGLMTEAVQTVIDYCFNDLGLDFLICEHWDINDRSRRVIEKCGFVYECDREWVSSLGDHRNSKYYHLLNPARN